jgi:8-oxo-dGTP pyrophosphatase MutT (NUDIX family)
LLEGFWSLEGFSLMDVALPSGEIVPAHDFFIRARARLGLDVPAALNDQTLEGTRGDLDLDPVLWERAGVKATRPAAVLIPVIDRPEPAVLLTLRTELPSHPGQIAFPGGKIDPGDVTPAAAALREAREEIGLARELIEPIGYLDLYLTFSGYRILPTVARVSPDYALALNAGEVADAFEVPLAFLMEPANHQRKTRDWKGIERNYYAMPFGERYIWGVTAGILRNLYERIYTS